MMTLAADSETIPGTTTPDMYEIAPVSVFQVTARRFHFYDSPLNPSEVIVLLATSHFSSTFRRVERCLKGVDSYSRGMDPRLLTPDSMSLAPKCTAVRFRARTVHAKTSKNHANAEIMTSLGLS